VTGAIGLVGAARRLALALALGATAAPALPAQASPPAAPPAPVDSVGRLVRVATGGGPGDRAIVERATPDSLVVLGAAGRFALARAEITRLEVWTRRRTAESQVGQVVLVGGAVTLLVGGGLAAGCLVGPSRGDGGWCLLGASLIAVPVGAAAFVAVFFSVLSMGASDEFRPVDPRSWSPPALRTGAQPVARPILALRLPL
jgi:hypothetical protein